MHVSLLLGIHGWLRELQHFNFLINERMLETYVIARDRFLVPNGKMFPTLGSAVHRWLTTAPGAPTTHWYQLRCVLSQPIYVMAGQEITGRLHMVSHKAQSYTLHLMLLAKMWGPGAEEGGILQTSSGKLDLKEPYYRMSQPHTYTVGAQDLQPHQLMQTQDIEIQCQVKEGSDLLQKQPSQNSAAKLYSV